MDWTDRARVERRLLDMRQVASADAYELRPGGRRVRLTAADGFDVELLPDRGLDLGAVSHRGLPLGFVTPAVLTAPAGGPDAETFARRFGAGLLTTCGLDQYGRPNHDDGQDLPQHGRASELVAADVATSADWVDGRYEVGVTGRMRQWRLFGEDLRWQRSVSIDLGGDTLRLRDQVTNAGSTPWPHMMLYHLNFGFPLIDEGTRIALPPGTGDPIPRDDWAATGLADWDVIAAPSPGLPERVFLHRLDPAGPGEITVKNPVLGVGVRIIVDPGRLGSVFQWVTAADGTYALGIEPGTTATMEGRADARARGLLDVLEPGESRSYAVDLIVTRAG